MLLASPHSIPWPDPAKDRGICKKNFNRIPDNYNGITQQHRKYNLLVIMACIFVDSKKTQPSVNIPKAIGVHSPSEKNPTKTPKSQTPKTPKTQIGTHKALLSILLFIHSRTLYKAVTPRRVSSKLFLPQRGFTEESGWRKHTTPARGKNRWQMRFCLDCSIWGTLFLLSFCHSQHNCGPRLLGLTAVEAINTTNTIRSKIF